ncbi:hypothetical protein MKEN_01387300 [Mycena kentingensis (nom. inval.)]|nr:hypothetical protein MKEN_01387300 [Mycena kentingensis (nom. inval.)]
MSTLFEQPPAVDGTIDINAAGREKIVIPIGIRPLSKAFALKQRAAPTLRTLTTTDPVIEEALDPIEQPKPMAKSVEAPTMWLPGPKDTLIKSKREIRLEREKLRRERERDVELQPERYYRNSSSSPTKNNKGGWSHDTPMVPVRTESSSSASTVAESPVDTPIDEHILDVDLCPCSDPEDCLRCSLRRLAAQFRAIVNERKQRLRLEKQL